MRQDLIEAAKAEIETMLKDYLKYEGLELLTAPHDTDSPMVMFEGIEDMPLKGALLQWDIRVILGIFGKPWQCDKLVDGIYCTLSAYRPTATELTTLLTSLHVEMTRFTRARVARRATIRYVLGEERT